MLQQHTTVPIGATASTTRVHWKQCSYIQLFEKYTGVQIQPPHSASVSGQDTHSRCFLPWDLNYYCTSPNCTPTTFSKELFYGLGPHFGIVVHDISGPRPSGPSKGHEFEHVVKHQKKRNDSLVVRAVHATGVGAFLKEASFCASRFSPRLDLELSHCTTKELWQTPLSRGYRVTFKKVSSNCGTPL